MKFAITPATIGKIMTPLAIRMIVNCHPMIPNSIGIRLMPKSDQAVMKATTVPMPAPARRNPAAIGMLTKGPLGVRLPSRVPIRIPRKPDSAPTHVDMMVGGNQDLDHSGDDEGEDEQRGDLQKKVSRYLQACDVRSTAPLIADVQHCNGNDPHDDRRQKHASQSPLFSHRFLHL